MSEQEIKEKVHNLRRFYINATLYCVVVFVITMIWAITGGGYFWPIWVIFGWGAGLALQAISIGIFPTLNEYFPYFTKSWEDEQIKKMKDGESVVAKPAASKSVLSKPVVAKKPAVKKSTPAKKKTIAVKK